MDILSKIKPITLKAGAHADTGQTGSGCFFNVISYLNGDAVITDRPDCVHSRLFDPIIAINDLLTTPDRQRLIPFIPRVMGTVNADPIAVSEWRVGFNRMIGELITRLSDFYAMLRQGQMKHYQHSRLFLDSAAEHLEQARRASYDINLQLSLLNHAAWEMRRSQTSFIVTRPMPFNLTTSNGVARDVRYTTRYSHEALGIFSETILRHLDRILPPADEPTQAHIERAEKLAATYIEKSKLKGAIADAAEKAGV